MAYQAHCMVNILFLGAIRSSWQTESFAVGIIWIFLRRKGSALLLYGVINFWLTPFPKRRRRRVSNLHNRTQHPSVLSCQIWLLVYCRAAGFLVISLSDSDKRVLFSLSHYVFSELAGIFCASFWGASSPAACRQRALEREISLHCESHSLAASTHAPRRAAAFCERVKEWKEFRLSAMRWIEKRAFDTSCDRLPRLRENAQIKPGVVRIYE